MRTPRGRAVAAVLLACAILFILGLAGGVPWFGALAWAGLLGIPMALYINHRSERDALYEQAPHFDFRITPLWMLGGIALIFSFPPLLLPEGTTQDVLSWFGWLAAVAYLIALAVSRRANRD